MFSTCSQYTLSLVLFFFFICVFLNEEIKEEKRRERGEIRSVWEVQVQSATFTVTIHSGSAPLLSVLGQQGRLHWVSARNSLFSLGDLTKGQPSTSEERGLIYDTG